MPVVPIIQLVPARQGIQFFRDADFYDYDRDEIAVPDPYDPDFFPVSRHIPAGTPEQLSSRSGTTSTGSSAAVTGAGAVEPNSSTT